MSTRSTAIIQSVLTALIHGVTYTIAKDVMAGYIEASGFILLRVLTAGILFWMVGFFIPKEKIDRSDIPRLILAGLFGASLNMLFFYEGLHLTSPISASVIMVNTPILVLVLSAILLKEKLEARKITGIVLGVIGAIVLIVFGRSSQSMALNPSLGNLLVFLNALFYGFYLIIVKKLMDKYNPFTLIKWMYLIGFLCCIPFGWEQAWEVRWDTMPIDIWYKVAFIIVFTTFINYALTLTAMKTLKPTTISVFIYLQPLFAAFFAIGLGKDSLDWIKVISAILIFSGVYLVSFNTNRSD